MVKRESADPACASCPIVKKADRRCDRADGKAPPNCPTACKPDLIKKSFAAYTEGEFAEFAREASRVERAGYERIPGGLKPARTRIVEIVDFARRMRYKKLGLVFCTGLRGEAKIAAGVFETNGFEVVSAICKVGGIPKLDIGLASEDLLNPDRPENICNPVMQAMIMNEAEVDFNILLGLCVGHDSLAIAHLKAPVTVFAVKDRLFGHSPLSCLYLSSSYYNYLNRPLFPEE